MVVSELFCQRTPFFPAGMAAVLLVATFLAGATTPAAAAPSCTFAQPFGQVAKAYGRVVRAKPAIRTISRSDERWTGQILLTDLRFVKWPKREARPASLTADFEFIRDDGCPFYPDPFHRYFVLDEAGGRFTIVNASAKRR